MRYFIIRLNTKLWIESYMGSHVPATTDKSRAFKFDDKKDAEEVAERYEGIAIQQRDWKWEDGF